MCRAAEKWKSAARRFSPGTFFSSGRFFYPSFGSYFARIFSELLRAASAFHFQIFESSKSAAHGLVRGSKGVLQNGRFPKSAAQFSPRPEVYQFTYDERNLRKFRNYEGRFLPNELIISL